MLVTSLDLAKQSPTGGGERVYQSLPLFVKEQLTCFCVIDYRDRENFPAIYCGMHSICKTCNKATRFSIAYLFRVCEVCSNYYLPKAEEYERLTEYVGQRAPRHRICSNCDVAPSRRPSGVKRSNFRVY